jgi:hypothetical protein
MLISKDIIATDSGIFIGAKVIRKSSLMVIDQENMFYFFVQKTTPPIFFENGFLIFLSRMAIKLTSF